MRYEAQEYTLAIPIDGPDAPHRAGLRRGDDAAVQRRRTTSATATRTRARRSSSSSLRAAAFGDLGHAEPEELAPSDGAAATAHARRALRRARARRPRSSRRDELGVGTTLEGPLVVEEVDGDHGRPAGLHALGRPLRLAGHRDRKGGLAMATTAVDPITTEVIRNAFNSAADEMNATLIRSAYTWIIYELKDCSVALLDAEHRVLGQSAGLPIFLGNLEVCTRVTEEMYGREAWQPGDVWIMNDSYLGGDAPERHHGVRADLPRRRAGRVRRLARPLARRRREGCGRADGLDRDLPGGPPARADEGGRGRPRAPRRRSTCSARNSRFSVPGGRRPERADRLRAHRASGASSAIIERFGTETVAAARDEIFAQTERLERIAIGEIPDGVYEAEGALDNDGLSDDPGDGPRPDRDQRRRHVDRPPRDRRRGRGPRQLRRGPGDLGLPGRLQAARRARPADERRLVRAALGAGAARLGRRRDGARRRARGTSARSGS